MNQQESNFHDTYISRLYRSFTPASRAAILFIIPFTVLESAHYLTAGSALIFSFPLVFLIYLLCGMLAAKIARQEGQDDSKLPSNGHSAALRLWLSSTVINLLISLLLGFTTLGISFIGGLIYLCLLGPLHALGSAITGWLGAWVYQQLANRSSTEI
jgi:hypothetical protein